MAAASSALFSPPPLSLISNPKPLSILAARNSFSSANSPIIAFPVAQSSVRRSYNLNLQDAATPITTKSWKISAIHESFSISEVSPVESSQEIVSTGDDGVSTIISALLLIAFIGLSILTIGVIYIAVTDFLQKREREKFEKEEAAKKKKKSGKKVKLRARAGPRGFGQKIEEDDDVDEAD